MERRQFIPVEGDPSATTWENKAKSEREDKKVNLNGKKLGAFGAVFLAAAGTASEAKADWRDAIYAGQGTIQAVGSTIAQIKNANTSRRQVEISGEIQHEQNQIYKEQVEGQIGVQVKQVDAQREQDQNRTAVELARIAAETGRNTAAEVNTKPGETKVSGNSTAADFPDPSVVERLRKQREEKFKNAGQ